MNEAAKLSAEPALNYERAAGQLVAQVLFERSRFGRHAREGSRATVERLLERLSYRRSRARRCYRPR